MKEISPTLVSSIFNVGRSIGMSMLFGLAFVGSANAATFFVEANGNDQIGTGSNTSPWKTVLQATKSVSNAGDIIHVGPGVFAENDRLFPKEGVSLEGEGQGITTITGSAAFMNLYPPTSGQGSLFGLYGHSSVNVNGQSISNLTLDGLSHQLQLGIDVIDRSNISIYNITIKDFYSTAISLTGLLQNPPDWKVQNQVLPADSEYISNIQIHDSILSNSGFSPGAAYNWSYGTINMFGVINSKITRVVIDETSYGGFNIKGQWVKNTEISRCDCRLAQASVWGGTGDAVEVGPLINSEVFGIQSNGGLSIGAISSRIHHNSIVAKPGDAGMIGIEFGGFNSSADHNYLDATALDPNNYSNGAYNMYLGFENSTTINNNVFKNTIGGVLFDAQGQNGTPSMNGINFDNNTLDGVSGIYGGGAISLRVQDPQSSINNTNIRNNIVVNSSTAGGSSGRGLTLTGSSDALSAKIYSTTISNNLFFGNPGGDIFTSAAQTTQSQNISDLAPQFLGIQPYPSPYYELSSASPARSAGMFIGLPYLGNGPPDIGSYVAPPGIFEAEMNYSIEADLGSNPIVFANSAIASGGHAVTLFDPGDTVRVHFYAPVAGKYTLSMRVRSGDIDGPLPYFAGGYSFKVDGVAQTFIGDPNSTTYDPSGGTIYWGNMNSGSLTLSAGLHDVEVAAVYPWGFVDVLHVNPAN